MKGIRDIRLRLIGLFFLTQVALGPFTPLMAQVSLQLGGSLMPEVSKGQADSHFYYNNIHRNFNNWRLGLREANLMARLELPKGFSIGTRLLLNRDQGQELNQLRLAMLQASWINANEKFLIHLGRIQTPFGAFYDRPLPQDRIFLSPPLTYGYFGNVSPFVGYSTALREPNILVLDNGRDWGLPMAYELGYSNGIHLHWEPRKDTMSFDFALLQAAPNQIVSNLNAIRPTLMIRANFQPTYFWKQGFSASYGGFMQMNEINSELEQLGRYRQLMIGTHGSLAYTYFEWTAELMVSWYNLPFYDAELSSFALLASGEIDQQRLTSIGGYTDLKFEMPFWAGAYVAYRFGILGFGRLNRSSSGSSWDDQSLRHSLGLGIPVNRSILIQSTYGIQQVSEQNWNLNSFRLALILYY